VQHPVIQAAAALCRNQPAKRVELLAPAWGSFTRFLIWEWRAGRRWAGESQKAKKEFREFFELSQNGDPEIPIFKRAKAEFAKLR
jgi:hypothetical protein